MTFALPPFFGAAPPLACSRWLGDRNCGRPGVWHILWTPDLENGIVCEEHLAEARRWWTYYAMHPYRADCSMPGRVFVEAENRCVVDEAWLGLPTEAEVHANVPSGEGEAP